MTTSLLSLLNDVGQSPALVLGQGTGLHDRHGIADAALVILVVGLQLVSPLRGLLVQRMLNAVKKDIARVKTIIREKETKI